MEEFMTQDTQITVEDLLRKIGALVIQTDILQAQVNALRAELERVKGESEKKSDDKK